MASEFSELLSHDSILKSLTADQTTRSFVVSNFPLQTTAETIAIYLLKKGFGGEIDHVHIPVEGTAVVYFREQRRFVSCFLILLSRPIQSNSIEHQSFDCRTQSNIIELTIKFCQSNTIERSITERLV